MRLLLPMVLFLTTQVFAGEIVSKNGSHFITESATIEYNTFLVPTSDADHVRIVKKYTKKLVKPQINEFCRSTEEGKAKIINSRFLPEYQCSMSSMKAVCGGSAEHEFICIQ